MKEITFEQTGWSWTASGELCCSHFLAKKLTTANKLFPIMRVSKFISAIISHPQQRWISGVATILLINDNTTNFNHYYNFVASWACPHIQLKRCIFLQRRVCSCSRWQQDLPAIGINSTAEPFLSTATSSELHLIETKKWNFTASLSDGCWSWRWCTCHSARRNN